MRGANGRRWEEKRDSRQSTAVRLGKICSMCDIYLEILYIYRYRYRYIWVKWSYG